MGIYPKSYVQAKEVFNSLAECVAYCMQQRAIYATAEAENQAHWMNMHQKDINSGGGWD